MTISTNLREVIQQLEVARGEAENVHDAVLAEVSDAVLETVKAGWPTDTWTSYNGWAIVKTVPLEYAIWNPIEYTSYVWSNRRRAGPPVQDLWLKLVLRAIDASVRTWEALISDRVRRLLA